VKALVWHGKRDVRVDTVPDPSIREPTDVVVRITTTGLCGSDLHLYEVLGPFLDEGDILGHEPMGVIEEVGPAVTAVKPGDRVVIPFNVSCGTCAMCGTGLHSQCETTQVREQGSGASLFGYTRLYGSVPGGQAEYLRVPFGNTLPIKVPDGPPDDRFVYLSDVLPTSWQAVAYADVPSGGTLAVLGLGPIGDMSSRIALHQGVGRVIGIDLVPERLERAKANGVDVIDLREHRRDLAHAVRERTDGRGVDLILDMVGGDYTPRNLDLLALEGRLIQIAFRKSSQATVDLSLVMRKRLTLTGSLLRPRSVAEKGAIAAALREHVWPLFERQAVRPVVHETFSLDRAADAHRLMESSEHIGKLALTTSFTG
jgi:threonine dehydrogenase-like Zn-dependent dehydrogenase